ncbi:MULTISPECIES: CinA family protein [Brevibacterium]|uniref:CinA family protein n=1 Tax=Brevibacterium TaxID=1696 RepID=UPI00223AB6D3|nr:MULTISPECIES: CinA family protein [Brevibacterium]MCT1830118.1 CinA family protein [Brevibacterium luteolum]MCT1922454.1 CinA family protein [Brevibacterium luteolum]
MTVAEIIRRLTTAGLTVATCESLTAGKLAATIADVPGASAVLRGGLVTYATDLKTALAGVDADLLTTSGAVHPQVAAQMATGAARACQADIALACTGVAGPDPQDGQPVGRVFTALLVPQMAEPEVVGHDFSGDRAQIRQATVEACLSQLAAWVQDRWALS